LPWRLSSFWPKIADERLHLVPEWAAVGVRCDRFVVSLFFQVLDRLQGYLARQVVLSEANSVDGLVHSVPAPSVHGKCFRIVGLRPLGAILCVPQGYIPGLLVN